MNPESRKIKINSLNVGKLGLLMCDQRDSLIDALHSYMGWYMNTLHGVKAKQPITLKGIQTKQSNLNRYRRMLGLAQINVLTFLKTWKLCEKDAHNTLNTILYGETD